MFPENVKMAVSQSSQQYSVRFEHLSDLCEAQWVQIGIALLTYQHIFYFVSWSKLCRNGLARRDFSSLSPHPLIITARLIVFISTPRFICFVT